DASLDGGLEPGRLLFDLLVLDGVLRYVDLPPFEQVYLANGDARRNGRSLQSSVLKPLLIHVSPKPSSMSFPRSAKASSASGPSTLTVSFVPSGQASIKSPMMLFPFTLCPSFSTHTSDRYPDDFFTNWAAARA